MYFPGDEIFSINSVPVQGMTHAEAISMFKEVKVGSIIIVVGRRTLGTSSSSSQIKQENNLASNEESEERSKNSSMLNRSYNKIVSFEDGRQD